jgi:type VI secretion system protein ImpK
MSAARTASLASVFGEVLTAIVRVRFRMQPVKDADLFRTQVRQSLQAPMQQARSIGYTGETVRNAVFAVVALLDESVLNLQDPVFAHWARQPLQEELFGGHLAGETFFRNVREYLAQPDSAELADVLELYCLCMLLGYRGRYALGGGGELHAQLQQARNRIERIRGTARLVPAGILPASAAGMHVADKWHGYLLWTACVLVCVVVTAFVAYNVLLATSGNVLSSSALNGL